MLRAGSRLYLNLRHYAQSTSVIEKLIKNNRVVVFMKGTPSDPSCGFSSAVVQILKLCNIKYSYVDVLEDENIRQDVKVYSNWPTIPQVYIDGKFIGGCDILLEMHKSGELMETLKKANLLEGNTNTKVKDATKNSAKKEKNENKSTE